MRGKGEEFSGTTIKGTWAKQGWKVRMAGVGAVVGENGDNCT